MDAAEQKRRQESCPHPHFLQERSFHGAGTGDFYCTLCGIDKALVKPRPSPFGPRE
jgi:hypothetical protein